MASPPMPTTNSGHSGINPASRLTAVIVVAGVGLAAVVATGTVPVHVSLPGRVGVDARPATAVPTTFAPPQVMSIAGSARNGRASTSPAAAAPASPPPAAIEAVSPEAPSSEAGATSSSPPVTAASSPPTTSANSPPTTSPPPTVVSPNYPVVVNTTPTTARDDWSERSTSAGGTTGTTVPDQ